MTILSVDTTDQLHNLFEKLGIRCCGETLRIHTTKTNNFKQGIIDLPELNLPFLKFLEVIRDHEEINKLLSSASKITLPRFE